MAGSLRRGVVAGALVLCGYGFAAAGEPSRPVNVLYAGSLLNLMEHGIGPAFEGADGGPFRGYAGGSNALANQIKGELRHGDVFISANPKVNDALEGVANGDWVSWYVGFAHSPVVIGYNPASRFAADLKSKPWYRVLAEPGIRIGRTDAKLDPKGALTLKLMDRAEAAYKEPGLARKVLGAPDNPDQVRPEETLVGQLQSGQLDVGFFYSTETTDLKIPSVPLPPEVALQANYTVTVLRGGANPAGAAAFVAFLLGPQGRAIMRAHGLDAGPVTAQGEAGAIPAAVRQALDAGK